MNQAQDITSPMSAMEKRACYSLSAIYALRMLGLFMILPVFSLYAEHLHGTTPLLTGLAISAYGLTQAVMQIPFGLLSDRFGRKLIIAIGLALFALGSIVAAQSDSIYGVILGRAIQGSGAIAAAVMALAADLTQEVHRTKAMAMIGISIGASFAVSIVTGPLLAVHVGVQGIFLLTAGLAVLGIIVLFKAVPRPDTIRVHRDAEPVPSQFLVVLLNADLLRLNCGIFSLHLILTASFVVLPLALRDAGLLSAHHWYLYLPVMVASMAMAVPFVVFAEKKRKLKSVFLGAVVVVGLADLGLFGFHDGIVGIGGFLFIFFSAFSLLEATLPSLISKMAPASMKGTAMGVYSTSQFLGAFLGGVCGGWLYGAFGIGYVFIFCVAIATFWFVIALGMTPPRYVSNLLLAVGALAEDEAALLAKRILQVPGVEEAVVLASDGVAYLKVDNDKLNKAELETVVVSPAEA